jgi:hypothetical protein
MIQLHAITRDEVRIDELSLSEGLELREVICGDLRALVSERDGSEQPTAEDVIAHAELIETVSRGTAVLPVRFGILHGDEDRLRAALRGREEELLALLERIEGRVEFVLRADDAPPREEIPGGDDSETPGRAYLERRLAEERADAADRAEIERRLEVVVGRTADLAAEVTARDGRHGPERCFLVRRDEAERFVESATRAIGDVGGLVLGGPWPPYTFAGMEP